MMPDGKRHVFVVDDNVVFQKLMKDMIGQLGYHLTQAGSAKQALELYHAHEKTIDVFLTDIMLPDSSGFDLLKKLRMTPNGRRVPVLMMSGATPNQTVQAEIDALECTFVDKSLTIPHLGPMLERLFTRLRETKST